MSSKVAETSSFNKSCVDHSIVAVQYMLHESVGYVCWLLLWLDDIVVQCAWTKN